MNLLEAMEQRKSVRSYSMEEVEERILTQLKDSLTQSSNFAEKSGARFEVLTGYSKEAKTGFLFGIGKIKAPGMIVGIYEKEEELIEIGFRLEQEVLFLVREGYGSCFLGTFDESALRSCCKLTDKEHIGIVLVFGKPNKDGSFMNGTFRSLAGSTKRKSYQEILLNANEYEEQSAIVDVVKHAIMAPSGNNMQPVRVMVRENQAVFYLKNRHSLVDLGIFLAHFYLCCLEIYDNVEVKKITQGQETIDGMESMITLSWQERSTCH